MQTTHLTKISLPAATVILIIKISFLFQLYFPSFVHLRMLCQGRRLLTPNVKMILNEEPEKKLKETVVVYFKVLSQKLSVGDGSRSPARDSNLGSLEYEVKVSILTPRQRGTIPSMENNIDLYKRITTETAVRCRRCAW